MLQCYFTVKLQKPFAEYETPDLPLACRLDTFIVTLGKLLLQMYQWSYSSEIDKDKTKKKTVPKIKQSGCD